MDLTATIVPKSDQINAEDLLAGPVTVTVESVTGGSAEQPVNINLVEFPGRPYRPSKTMRKVLVKLWKKESDDYTGRRMTLYRDPDVKFGGVKVGGIKISHLSHIDKTFSLALTETRGKRALHTVEPLRDDARPARPATDPNAVTAEQLSTLAAALTAAGLDDRDSVLAFYAETIDRVVDSSKALTKAEASRVIDALKAVTAPSDGGAA